MYFYTKYDSNRDLEQQASFMQQLENEQLNDLLQVPKSDVENF